MDRRDHGDPESVALATVHHNFHDWHEILEPMDSLLRQLLVKYDNLQTVLSAQDRHIADIHRLGILWEKSSNEVNRHFEGIQDQVRSKDSEVENCKTRLRECSEECGWLRGENSRLSRENRDLSQKEISMRATLDRFSRNLHSVTKENEDLKQRVRSKTKEPAEMDAGFESNPESEEELPSEASRIRRKRGSADLRVPKCGENVPQLNKKPRDEPVQRQEQLNNQFPSQLPTRNSESDNLRSKLKQAETHIINIGGNLGALLPREVVEEEFKSLIAATQIWITNFMRPEISTPEQRSQASRRARNIWVQNPTRNISRVRNQDYCAASEFPSADESIFLVMIFDLLVERIFSAKVMYGDHDLQREVDVINQLVPQMEKSSKSTKRLYNARRWMSEAMITLLAGEETGEARNLFSNNLTESILRTIGMREVLGPNDRVALERAKNSIHENVVLPAIELGDKLACAIDRFYLDIQSYWSEPCGPQTRLFRDLANLDCRNFGKGPPRFRLDKMQKKLSETEIKNRLRIICPAIPAMIMTEACDKTWGPPTVLVKEQIWVAWDQEEAPTLSSEEQGYFWLLYNGYANSLAC